MKWWRHLSTQALAQSRVRRDILRARNREEILDREAPPFFIQPRAYLMATYKKQTKNALKNHYVMVYGLVYET
jgi:hypothetical protein